MAALLLAPLVAMRFTSEVNWTASDFATAAVLLVGAGLGFELLARSSAGRARRTFLGSAIALSVALVWAHGAVGIV